MQKPMSTIGVFIIASAIIWGAVIILSAVALKGTDCYREIQNILVGGVISHIILIWGPLALLFKGTKVNKPENSSTE